MKKYSSIVGLAVMTIFMHSCVLDADVEVPEVDPKLVVQGFISPQEEWVKIRVSKSQPLFGVNDDSGYEVESAQVRLMGPTDTVMLDYDVDEEAYLISQVDFPILPGETYSLEVSSPGLPTVYSTTTVPGSTPFVSSLTYVGTQNIEGGTFGESSTNFEFNVKWMDTESGESYYRLTMALEGIGAGSEPLDLLYTDALNDGEMISKNVFLSTWYTDINPEQEPVGVYILSLDEHYYRYHLTEKLLGSDDPFSEPVQMHSNITNGLGCFGSYNGSYQQF